MRDGIFFIANGNAGKVVTMSSFGDLLSMVYNPDKNPPPVILKSAETGADVQGRLARQYPFNAPGEIAVDSRRTIFVEERVPEERRSFDEASQSSLEYVVLRFSREGEYLDFLGQEGVGGTPFPLISSIHITPKDECVVVTITGEGWLVFWFDPNGMLLSTIAVRRDGLPVPDTIDQAYPSLDGLALSPDGAGLLLKVDYFRDTIDADTKTRTGIEYATSWAWVLDRTTGSFSEHYELPGFVSLVDNGTKERPVPRGWDFVGTARGAVFMSAVDDDGSLQYGVFDPESKTLSRFSLIIDPDEMLYNCFHLSPEGILSGILASRYEARIVWWRFDKVTGA